MASKNRNNSLKIHNDKSLDTSNCFTVQQYTALKKALLLNTINSRPARGQLKTHLQVRSPVVMEIQIPAMLGWYESNQVKPSRHMCIVKGYYSNGLCASALWCSVSEFMNDRHGVGVRGLQMLEDWGKRALHHRSTWNVQSSATERQTVKHWGRREKVRAGSIK